MVGFGLLIFVTTLAYGVNWFCLQNIRGYQGQVAGSLGSVESTARNNVALRNAQQLVLKWAYPVLQERTTLGKYFETDDYDEQQALFAEFGRLGERHVLLDVVLVHIHRMDRNRVPLDEDPVLHFGVERLAARPHGLR